MKDKRILVTGASSGIGQELARQLGAKGATVGLAARSTDRLEQLASEIVGAGGPRPAVLPTDLGQRGEAKTLAERALRALGRVDVLVNNAGVSLHGLQWVAGDRGEARELFEVNYWSPLALIRELVPSMRERGSGAVVNVTSMIQVSPFPALGHACSSKAALAIATQTLRMELRNSGIRVIEVPLGVIDTPGSFGNRALPGAEKWLDSGPVGSAEGAARAIISALEGRRQRVIYPRRIAIGYTFPGLARRYAQRFARHTDPDYGVVRLAGSAGDEQHRAAREEWERRHGQASATGT
jgi:short-subunit dehydrogenase